MESEGTDDFKFLVDTHPLIWYLEEKRLPEKVVNIFNGVENGGKKMYIPVVALFEILYLIEKGKTSFSEMGEFLIRIGDLIDRGADIEIASLGKSGFDKVLEFFDELKELENRDTMIVGTALDTESILITKDKEIRELPMLKTVWR
jgi:PIN domain nuclease of toxin-antitoxin system